MIMFEQGYQAVGIAYYYNELKLSNELQGHWSLIPWIDSQLIRKETRCNLKINWKPSVLSLVKKRKKSTHL